ncbi:MAG: glycerophosphodiester phosphodiesterase family protein [Nitrospirales bacterium]|nr:glycerophosphodiester phosphodiesterase family protein [Nitrospira sp.]MDR4502887.1 glycerophosphodiester phosphodiesterase family protein [Nitrospirales bacterium]
MVLSRARFWLVAFLGTTLWIGCAAQPVTVSCHTSTPHIDDLPTRGIAAHRGGRMGCPSNTLGAFQRAICLGVHQIELDARMTKDRVLVIAHDDVMADVDGNVLRISQSTLWEVRRLNLGACTDGAMCDQHIPTLEEVLAMMPLNIWVNLDVKENHPEAGRLAVEVVSHANRLPQVIFSVRDKAAPAIRQFEEKTGKPVWISNMSRRLFRRQYVDTTIASCDEFIQLVNLPLLFRGKPCEDTVNRLKQAGVFVNYSWLREDNESSLRDELGDLFERRVNFVLVDHPDVAMQAAHSLGISPVEPRWRGVPPFSCPAPTTCVPAHY